MRIVRKQTWLLRVAPLVLLCAYHPVGAQSAPPAQPAPSPAAQTQPPPNESDPTKAVFVSVRSEYSNLRGDAWTHAFVYRMDRALFRNRGYLGDKIGVLTRFDLPIVTARVGGETHTGLGDLFLQTLWVPKIDRRFGLAVGSGFILPTATYRTLGSGKWQVVPAVVPVWFFPKGKGLFFFKLANQLSFAGNRNRADVNSLVMQPFLLYRFHRRWWFILDNEAKVNWENNNRMSYKSAFEVGRIITPRFGLSVKPEFPWGRHRQGDWTLKFILTWYKPSG